jgi:hypothetical protein
MLKTASIYFSTLAFLCPIAFADQASEGASSFGGTIFSVDSSDYLELEDTFYSPEETKKLAESARVYQEFLDRGTYSRVRSIGGGSFYSRGYSTGGTSRRRGAAVVRSRSSSRARTRSRFSGRFATIDNRSSQRRRGFRSGFARISN